MDARTPTQAPPEDRKGEARYIVLATATGAAAGLVTFAFHWLIERFLAWPDALGRELSGWTLVLAGAVFTMACTLLAVYIVRRFAPEAGGSGVQEVEGAMLGLRPMRWRRVLVVKFAGGVTAIGSGLALGREGPAIHMGATLGQALAEWFRTTEIERRGLLACGAAAGLACAFNAPIAAALFVFEETRKEFPYTFRTYIGVIFAAIASTAVGQVLGGNQPDLPVELTAVPLALLPGFLLLGMILGVVGVALNRSILRAVTFAAVAQKRAPYVYPAIVGLAMGALVIVMPLATSGGENVIMGLARQNVGLAVLLALGVIRFVTLVACYSTGVPGGIFAPILTLAVCVGLAFAHALRVLLPDADIVPFAFAIAAMGGLFSASVRAPIVGIALALELTGSYALTLPVMLTCVSADLFAQWCGGRPIYAQLLERSLSAAGLRAPATKAEPTGLV